jgi:hypothetical protein
VSGAVERGKRLIDPDNQAAADYLQEAEQRARKFSGAWTGTSGTLAADVMNLLAAVKRAREDRRGTVAPASDPRRRCIIGFAGPAGVGKDLAASMVPGARRIGFADALYEGLSAMLGIDVQALRLRDTKETPIPGIGKSRRQLLQTLGTDWGRNMVSPDIWTLVAYWRWEKAAADGCPLIVVPDVRFRNEAAMIRESGGEVWLVHRPDVAPVAAHVSEAGLPLSMIDRLVVNTGSPDDLRARVAETLRQMDNHGKLTEATR